MSAISVSSYKRIAGKPYLAARQLVKNPVYSGFINVNGSLNLLVTVFLLLGSVNFAQAQKLPNVQEKSLRAPANIKIDGKPTEWHNDFQAYNQATDIFYTISNDNDNLYLVVHSADVDVLTKITNCGVVFKIDPTSKKTDENTASITFPVFDLRYGNKPYIRFSNMAGLRVQREADALNSDSVSKVANKKLHDNEKFIRTKGLPGVDTLLSVFNRTGIKVAEAFDSTMVYTYELAVPLKYLNLPTGKSAKFAYHILLPGMDVDRDLGFGMTKDENGAMRITTAPGAQMPRKEHFKAVMATTDFWGEYTLANK
jgi:hypothetical protein